ncbi:MAG: 30S ribosomal protein S3 [Chloroflexi bacterium]|nr:30S ribosomal protein S3 [Chloroflexota bacterium]
MGHKVHPMGFRLGVIRDWQAKWYADKHYADFLQEDMKLRQAIQSRYADAAVSLVEIERQANQVSVTINTARPGIVIGRGGQRVDETRRSLEQLIKKRVQLNIHEIQRPEFDAYLVAKSIAEQIERRVAYRRAMKQTTLRTIQAGAKGMKVSCAGRLGGAEIARRLNMHEGQVPLHTLRADIDYGFTEARTAMGRIGVKVWIYKGEILPERKTKEAEEIEETAAKPVAEGGAEVVTVVGAEAPAAEPVAEVAPAVEAEAPPAKPTVRRRTRAVSHPEPAVDASTETVAAETPSAKPIVRRKTRAVSHPEPAVDASTETVAAETPPAKPAVRRRTRATPPPKPEAEKQPAEAVAEPSAAVEPAAEPGENNVTT